MIFSLPAVKAQIVPDNTLPNASIVEAGCTVCTIDGGTTRGNHLFHSFREFSVPTGGTAFFNNASQIRNILTRVTGHSVSNIDGLLRSNGSANLFLINPNGILLGPNARLDIGGSFVASTADRILFDNGFVFSTTNPQAPPLLTVTAPIGLQFGTNPGSIRVQGRLQVGSGQTLALVGGEVALVGGSLTAAAGRIELGSVAANSWVAIAPTNPGWALNYQGVQQFQDIRLAQAARVDASGSGGGSIQIQGRRLSITEGSRIFAVTEGTQAGRNFIVRAAESVEVTGFNPQDGASSQLAAQTTSTGNGGNLTIETGTFRLTDGAQVKTDTFRTGKGGDLTVRARSVEVSGSNPRDGDYSFLAAQTQRSSTGNAGNLTIETEMLQIAHGGFVSTRTLGGGNGGDLAVRARSVEVIGFNPQDGSNSFLATQTRQGSTGNAGSLTIETGTLRLVDGGFVSTSTLGAGNGGNLTVRARSIEAIGFVPRTNSPSAIAAQANAGSTGNAGNLTIETDTLRVLDSARISTRTFGTGNGGNLTVRARSVEVAGFDSQTGAPSFLAAQTQRGSTGNAGNLTIETDTLRVTEGAIVSTNTFGTGNGGNLTVRARSVEVAGFDPQTGASSALTAQANSGSTGIAGNLTIETDTLRVADGSVVTTSTFGTGSSGDLTVQARSLEVIGFNPQTGEPSFLATQASSRSTGNAGDISLTTDRLHIANRGEIIATSRGRGSAGNIQVQAASQIILAENARISSNTNAGKGNITFTTPLLLLRQGSRITTNASGNASGGNIRFNGGFLVAVPAENSDVTANAFAGSGGRVDITAQGIFGIAFRPRVTPLSDLTASSEFGIAGVVAINTPDVDLNRELAELPTDLIDASRLIAVGCAAEGSPQADRGEFYQTGRGGIAPSPIDPISSRDILEDLQPPPSWNGATQSHPPIVEAQGWQRNDRGEIILVASTQPYCRR